MDTLFNDPLIDAMKALPNADEIYLVGGSVRDHFMQRTTQDLDFACKNGIETGRRLANQLGYDFFILDRERDCCRLIRRGSDGSKAHFDINGLRAPTIENDLLDRDFTINAMAIPITSQKLADPCGGLADLRSRQLRMCAQHSIHNDPLRILRAVRFCAQFSFRMDAGLISAIRSEIPSLAKVSAERVRDELHKIFEGPRPALGLDLMDKLEILEFLFPEIAPLKEQAQSAPHVQNVWPHTVSVIKQLKQIMDVAANEYNEEKANADLFTGLLVLKLGRFRQQLRAHFSEQRSEGRSRAGNLIFAALFHDIAKPACASIEDSGRIRFFGHDEAGEGTTARIAEQLKLSANESTAVSRIVRNHMRMHFLANRAEAGDLPSRKQIYRYFRKLGTEGVDLVLLSLADLRATYEQTLTQQKWRASLDVAEALLAAWYEQKDQIVSPPALVNGHQLMQQLGLEPSEMLGKLLEAIREGQASGEIHTKEEALEKAKREYVRLGNRNGQ